jgi:hypothetical protein
LVQADASGRVLFAGIIETMSDVDVLSMQLTSGLSVAFSVDVAPFTPTLDVQLTLLSPSCTPVSVVNPVDLLSVPSFRYLPTQTGQTKKTVHTR